MTYSEYGPGYRGSTRASWESKSADKLFASIAKEHPKANRDRLIKLFIEQGREEPEVIDDLLLQGGTNRFNRWEQMLADEARRSNPEEAVRGAEAKRAERTKAAQERAAEVEEEAASMINRIQVLNQEMWNGKRRRNCTRPELLKGSAFERKLAAKLKNNHTLLGSVINETEARAILAKCK